MSHCHFDDWSNMCPFYFVIGFVVGVSASSCKDLLQQFGKVQQSGASVGASHEERRPKLAFTNFQARPSALGAASISSNPYIPFPCGLLFCESRAIQGDASSWDALRATMQRTLSSTATPITRHMRPCGRNMLVCPRWTAAFFVCAFS